MGTGDYGQTYATAERFLDEDGNADTLKSLLEVDDENNGWTFDDISLDSGTFGKVADTELVEKHDGMYRLANPDAVRDALNGTPDPAATTRETTTNFTGIDYRSLAGLLGALFVVVVARIIGYRSVFQGGRVVSPANDQYFYRYWMEQLLARSSGPFDFGVLFGAPWSQTTTWNERPLTHATNWFAAELLGGDQWAADMVAAWLPILLTIALAVVVYRTALVLTNDDRVAGAAVLVVALAPIHVTYTQVGWLSNRAHQYLWFGLVLYCLIWLANDVKLRTENGDGLDAHLRSGRTWAVTAGLGLAFAAWIHSWGGSASLAVPMLGYAWLRTTVDLRQGLRPTRANLPLLAGLTFGAIVAVGLHLGLGWHGRVGPAATVILAVLAALTFVLGDLWRICGQSPQRFVFVQPAVAGVVAAIILALRPNVRQSLLRAFSNPFSSGPVASQSVSLYGLDSAVFFGPVAQIGFEFYVGFVATAWCIWYVYQQYEPAWFVLAVFTAYYLVAAGIMLRFTGKLVIAMSVLAGFGIVTLLAKLDLTTTPYPIGTDGQAPRLSSTRRHVGVPEDWRHIARIGIALLLVSSASLVYIPLLSTQHHHGPNEFRTAMAIQDHAETTDREYPRSKVFAEWDNYRMYNYFVSGEARSERFGKYYYQSFRSDTDPDLWVENSVENPSPERFGYVVVSKQSAPYPANTTQVKLYERLGSGNGSGDGLAHYQLIHISEDGRIMAFAVVPGATIVVPGRPGETVNVTTEVSVSGRTFVYRREAVVGENGSARIQVPYPGTYDVDSRTVTVSRRDIRTNGTVVVGGGERSSSVKHGQTNRDDYISLGFND